MYVIKTEINGIERDIRQQYNTKKEAVEATFAIVSGLFDLADYQITVFKSVSYMSNERVFQIENWE
jgi:hypothetical protein